MNQFAFNQLIQTPKGAARFIGYMTTNNTAQVSRTVAARDLTREECEQRKPSVEEMSRDEFSIWQKTAHFTINEIIPVGEISGAM